MLSLPLRSKIRALAICLNSGCDDWLRLIVLFLSESIIDTGAIVGCFNSTLILTDIWHIRRFELDMEIAIVVRRLAIEITLQMGLIWRYTIVRHLVVSAIITTAILTSDNS